MKSYLLCLAVCAVFASCVELKWQPPSHSCAAVGPEFLQRVKTVAKQCQDKPGPIDEYIEIILSHKEITSQQSKCFRACAYEKLGAMDANGKWVVAKSLEYLKQNNVNNPKNLRLGTQVYQYCGNIQVDKNHCLAAEQYAACIRKKAHEVGFVLATLKK